MANVLSDHTPQLIQFPKSPRPKTKFQFYEMWSKHKDFYKIIDSGYPVSLESRPLQYLRIFQSQLRPLLCKLNKDNYAKPQRPTRQSKNRANSHLASTTARS